MASEDSILELAASLSAEEVPVKLRCATCSLIAYNALRLPCCEQNICETCHKELEDVCQVCHHEPLDKNLCTPNKSLRTTTKVFLKRKLLEREKDQRNKVNDNATTQTAVNAAAPQNSINSGDSAANVLQPTAPHLEGTLEGIKDNREESMNSALDEDGKGEPTLEAAEAGHPDEEEVDGNEVHDESWPSNTASGQINQSQNFNQTNDMSGMGGFSMDFTSMMAMGGMPNMMAMGLDPMMMSAMASSMFGGFGGPNMGMNGMNAGMGQSQFGGPLMADQNSYVSSSQGNGNFGNQAGYNMPSHQGNFNQMNHQQYAHNDFQNGYGRPGFYGRGGRGRRGGYYGAYGRHQYANTNQGNFGYGNNSFQHNQAPYQQPVSTEQTNASASREEITNLQGEDEQSQQAQQAGEVHASSEKTNNALPENSEAQAEQDPNNMQDEDAANGQGDSEGDKPLPIQTFISDEPRLRNPIHSGDNVPPGPSIQFPTGHSGAAAQTVGAFESALPAEPRVIGVPGAPTGPRALREGLPNTGRSGLAISKKPHLQATSSTVDRRKSRSPSPNKDDTASRHQSRSRSQTPPLRPQGSPERRYSNREQSPPFSNDHSADQYNRPESEQAHSVDDQAYRVKDDHIVTQESRRSRERYENVRQAAQSRRDHSFDRENGDRSRNRGYDDHPANRHEDEQDRDRFYNNRRNEDRNDEYQRRRSRSPSHRSNSPRSKGARDDGGSRKRRYQDDDREDEPRQEGGRRRRERHRRKRSRRHRSTSRDRSDRYIPSSREESKPATPITPNFPPQSRRESSGANPNSRTATETHNNTPMGPRGSKSRIREEPRRNKQAHDRRAEEYDAGFTSKEHVKDPHTLEREARDRERLMKEMQRRATFDGGRAKATDSRRRKYDDENREGSRNFEREREGNRHR